MTSLFGGETGYLTAALALGVVLVLIVLVVWLIKLLGQASQSVGRGRNRRLAVIDTVAIDQRRQAIILRRDNVEHLIVTGGPADLVVETGFEPPAMAPRPARRPLGQPESQAVPEPALDPAPEPHARGVSRLRALGGNGTARSLRHTGLLRTVSDEDPALAGGKPDNGVHARPDSATNGSALRVGDDDRLEAATEADRDDYADQEKSKL